MGASWSMESISWMFSNRFYSFYISDFINCVQGFIIFILFVWKPKVRDLVRQRLMNAKLHCVIIVSIFSLPLTFVIKFSLLKLKEGTKSVQKVEFIFKKDFDQEKLCQVIMRYPAKERYNFFFKAGTIFFFRGSCLLREKNISMDTKIVKNKFPSVYSSIGQTTRSEKILMRHQKISLLKKKTKVSI